MERLLGVTVLLLLFASTLRADVLLSAPNVTPNTWWAVTSNGVKQEAAQFSLSATSFVSTIDLTLFNALSGNTYNLSLVSGLTGPVITYATFTLSGSCCNSDPHSVTLNQTLNAGTYYLLLQGVNITSFLGGWQMSDGTLVENAGTITNGMWQSNDGGATWTLFEPDGPDCIDSCYVAVFTVNGSSGAVPEPASLVLLGSGLLLGASRWRRRT